MMAPFVFRRKNAFSANILAKNTEKWNEMKICFSQIDPLRVGSSFLGKNAFSEFFSKNLSLKSRAVVSFYTWSILRPVFHISNVFDFLSPWRLPYWPASIFQNQYQDILSHETIIDNVSDKAETLATPNVAHRMEQVKARYNKLCDTGKVSFRLIVILAHLQLIWKVSTT
jgi:hypothetical protein